MKHSLTICVITGREEPGIDWIASSLRKQMLPTDRIERLILVDAASPAPDAAWEEFFQFPTPVTWAKPKPTIWQGEHRRTREDWWAAANARNTGLCLAGSAGSGGTGWIAWLDDRCVLGPEWLQAIREAMGGGATGQEYAVFGAYEKRHGMVVKDGVIVEPGRLSARDGRLEWLEQNGWKPEDGPIELHHGWAFGCAVALPVEWALRIGGFEQAMDGMGFEDVLFGMMLDNHGLPLRYDPRMFLTEDRTPGSAGGCGKVYRKEDKGVSPVDKSHRALELFGTAWQTTCRHQVWQSRKAVQSGKGWPVLLDAACDWWDGEVVGDEFMKR